MARKSKTMGALTELVKPPVAQSDRVQSDRMSQSDRVTRARMSIEDLSYSRALAKAIDELVLARIEELK